MTYEEFVQFAEQGVLAIAVRDNRAIHGVVAYKNAMAFSPYKRDRACNAIVACHLAHQRAHNRT